MKKLLFTLLIIATAQLSFAQQAIAKIKYEEAEEAFAANNYEETVAKLIEVETILKSTNPRVMYLKITAQSKIIEKNPTNDYKIIENTRKLSNNYLKNYENVPNNEDKFRDIYKIAESLKKYPENEAKFNLTYTNRKLGNTYMYGDKDIVIDYAKALQYYTIAADQGDIPSKAEIGRIYHNGFWVAKDTKKAFVYFKEAADKGNAVGQNGLGVMYDIDQDFVKAKALYELAANQGNAKGQYNLGFSYFKGEGVALDLSQALKYFQLAVDNGYVDTQCMVGNCYLLLRDYKNAMIKYELDVKQGITEAFLKVGLLYEDGLGVEKNRKVAKMYFKSYNDLRVRDANEKLK